MMELTFPEQRKLYLKLKAVADKYGTEILYETTMSVILDIKEPIIDETTTEIISTE